jgi:prohibitin 2
MYAEKNITLEKVLLRHIGFSKQYAQAIEEKQVAEQRIQKAEYQRQEAAKLKQKKIIEAEADAQAIKLKGDYLKKYPQVIQFEFVQKMAQNITWGIMPDKVLPLLNLGMK